MNEIIVGIYDGFVVGYHIERRKEFSLEQSFVIKAHQGIVRCLARSEDGTKLLSIGSDEMINLYDLKRRKLLQTWEGPVTCATFVGNSHLICGLEDGNIHIYEYKSSSIELAKTIKGHKESVISLSAHPSGKILLSISKDNTMRTWNLIKGRCAYVTNCLKSRAHLIQWSRKGDKFIITVNDELYLYGISGSLERTIKLEKRVNWIDFIDDETVSVAIDNGVLEFFHITNEKFHLKLEAHETRIKSVKRVEIESDKKTESFFATASSDGSIKLWSLDDSSSSFQKLSELDMGARPVCMTVRL